MRINIFKPKDAVKSALENPSISTALILWLLPSIAYIVGFLMLGLVLEPLRVVLGVVLSYVKFFIVVIVIYVVARILKGKSLESRFVGIVSAYSLMSLVYLILTIAGTLLLFTFSPQLIGFVKQVQMNELSVEGFAAVAFTEIDNNQDAINFLPFVVLLIISAVTLLFGFYLFYLIVSRVFNFGIVKNIMVWIVLLLVIGFIPF